MVSRHFAFQVGKICRLENKLKPLQACQGCLEVGLQWGTVGDSGGVKQASSDTLKGF